ncbi:MAG: hypothetical protein ABJF69_04070 [Anderseniella sp.]
MGREELFERRIASVTAHRSHDSGAGGGMKAQAGLFAGGLLLTCCATFALVYYFASEDTPTAASSHFQAPTLAQATLGVSSPEASNNTTSSNRVTTANSKALSDIANGNWVVLPADVNKQVQTGEATSVRQQTAGQEPPGSAATRQELFESFQSYLQNTGRARVTDNPHQEALFNSFVRWNVEVANAN